MSRRADACFVAVAGFAVAFLLRQHTFYKDDGHVYLMSIVEGQLQHPHHMLYKPLVHGLHRATAWLGASLYDAGLLASALGTAVGLGCASLATRWLGLSRAAAWAVPGLMLAVPALLFFATVVELHGVFLGFAGPSLLAAAAMARAPCLARGVALGLALALAYVAHASAALLPALLLPLGLFYPERAVTWPGVRRLLLPASAACAVLAGCLLALPALGRSTGLGVDTGSAAAYVARDALAFAADARRWGSTLFHEWLAPYAPLNAVALALCAAGAWRAQACCLWLAVVPYYLLCVFLLPSPEFGAYLTPFAWPLALLALRALRPAALATIGLAGFAGGVAWVAAHDRPELARRFADGVRAAAGAGEAFLLLGDHDEVKATLIALPQVQHLLVLHAGAVPEAALADTLQQLDAVLQAQWRAGRTVLLTDGAATMLPRFVPSGPLVLPALQARYRLDRIDPTGTGSGFCGWRIVAP